VQVTYVFASRACNLKGMNIRVWILTRILAESSSRGFADIKSESCCEKTREL